MTLYEFIILMTFPIRGTSGYNEIQYKIFKWIHSEVTNTSTVNPSSSLLNFKPIITSVGVVLQLEMINIFKNSLAYFDCDIKIPLSDVELQCQEKTS